MQPDLTLSTGASMVLLPKGGMKMVYFGAVLMHRAVTVMAFPTHKVKIEVASMLMMVYQGLKCVIGQKEVANLVGHLVRKPWKGAAPQAISSRKI